MVSNGIALSSLINDPNGRDEFLSRQATGEKPFLLQDSRDFDACEIGLLTVGKPRAGYLRVPGSGIRIFAACSTPARTPGGELGAGLRETAS